MARVGFKPKTTKSQICPATPIWLLFSVQISFRQLQLSLLVVTDTTIEISHR